MQSQMGINRYAAVHALGGGRVALDGRTLGCADTTLPLREVQGKVLAIGSQEMIVLGQYKGRAPTEQLTLG